MNDLTAITFSGRRFSSDELALIRQAAIDYAPLASFCRETRKLLHLRH